MASSLKIHSIGASQYKSIKFVPIAIDFLRPSSIQKKVYAHINQELHLIEELKANMHVGNNIIGPEEISININNNFALIASFIVIIFIHVRRRCHFI